MCSQLLSILCTRLPNIETESSAQTDGCIDLASVAQVQFTAALRKEKSDWTTGFSCVNQLTWCSSHLNASPAPLPHGAYMSLYYAATLPLSTNESLADASIVSNLHLRFPLREPCWACWTMALLWCKNDNGASVSGKSSHKQEVVSCGLFNIFLAATVFSFQRKWTSPRCTNCFEFAGDLLGTPLRRPHSDER